MNTNNIPGVFDNIPVLNYIPQKYHGWVIIGLWGSMYLLRFGHAMANGRGIVGSVKAVLFGTNTPSVQKTSPTAQV